MTLSEQREAARQFANKWNGKGREDEDARSYWFEILQKIFGKLILILHKLHYAVLAD